MRTFNPRTTTFGKGLDQVLDRIVEQINKLKAPAPAPAVPTAFNDGSAQVRPFLIYGVSGGALAPARSGVSPVEPLFQSLQGAAPGAIFPVLVAGPTTVVLEDPGQSVSPGVWGWLSANTPGTVTTIMPAAGRRYRACQFLSAKVETSGQTAAHLFLFPEGANTL